MYVHMHMKYKCNVSSHCSTESSDSMGVQGASQGMEDKLCSAMNPNRAEMPGNKRKGSYDQVHHQHVYNAHYTCIHVCTCVYMYIVHVGTFYIHCKQGFHTEGTCVYIYIYIYTCTILGFFAGRGGLYPACSMLHVYIYTCTCTLECVLAVLYNILCIYMY